ncbi:MAG: hypothetical protein R2750_03850 [Bacteroidales bacterium]
MKKLIHLMIVLVIVFSCSKENETLKVEYRVSEASAATDITYRNAESEMISETVEFNSSEDAWNLVTDMKRGDIVFVSALYHDSTSSVNVQVLVDGKIIKQKSSVNEPEKYVIASGTVPY